MGRRCSLCQPFHFLPCCLSAPLTHLSASFSGTLELKATKESAHSDCINSVAFSPDGKTIVSGSFDKTIKVWDATPRPFNASEWEEVDISGMEKDDYGEVKIEGLGYISSNYWKNTVTGELRKDYSSAGKPSALKTIKVWDAGQPFHLLPPLLSSPLMPFLLASQVL